MCTKCLKASKKQRVSEAIKTSAIKVNWLKKTILFSWKFFSLKRHKQVIMTKVLLCALCADLLYVCDFKHRLRRLIYEFDTNPSPFEQRKEELLLQTLVDLVSQISAIMFVLIFAFSLAMFEPNIWTVFYCWKDDLKNIRKNFFIVLWTTYEMYSGL